MAQKYFIHLKWICFNIKNLHTLMLYCLHDNDECVSETLIHVSAMWKNLVRTLPLTVKLKMSIPSMSATKWGVPGLFFFYYWVCCPQNFIWLDYCQNIEIAGSRTLNFFIIIRSLPWYCSNYFEVLPKDGITIKYKLSE